MRERGLVEAFLRGHLWVEKFLTDLIEEDLVDASAMRLERTPFAQKIGLAQKLGLIAPGEAEPLRIMNKIRNKLAHDLADDPTAEDLRSLERSLTGLHLQACKAQLNSDAYAPDVKRLEFVVHAILIRLEMHRLQHKYHRDDNKAELDTYNLIRALNDRTGTACPRRGRGVARDIAKKFDTAFSDTDGVTRGRETGVSARCIRC